MSDLSKSKDKVIFLKTQVDELTSKLNEYQQKYSPIHSDHSDKDSSPEPDLDKVPMFVDKKLVTPLLKEYNELIEGLKTGKCDYEDEIDKIASLTLRLKENPSYVSLAGGFEENDEDYDDERDDDGDGQPKSKDTWLHGGVMYMQDLQRLLSGWKDGGGMDGRGADERMKEFLSSISTTSHPTNPIITLFNDYNKMMENTKTKLTQENESLRNNIESLRSNLRKGDVVVAESLQHATNNNLQLVENALRERDKSLLEARRAEGEVLRLKGVIDEVVEGAKTTIGLQAEKIKSESTKKISNLEHKLDIYEKEKEMMEARLMERRKDEEVKRRNEAATTDNIQLCENTLSSQLTLVTQQRDDLEAKVKLLEEQLKGVEKIHKKEKEYMKEEIEQLSGRMEEMKKEQGWMEEERKRLVNEYEDLRRNVLKEKRWKEDTTRVVSKQVLFLQQAARASRMEQEARMEALKEEHNSSLIKLHKAINVKKLADLTLKQESDSRMKGLEKKMEIVKEELERERKKREEVMNLLQHHQLKTQQAEDKLCKYSRNVETLEANLMHSKHQHHAITAQIRKPYLIEMSTSEHLEELNKIVQEAKKIS